MKTKGGPGHSVSKSVQGITPMKAEDQSAYDARAKQAWATCKKTKDKNGNVKCKGSFNEATRINHMENMSKSDWTK